MSLNRVDQSSPILNRAPEVKSRSRLSTQFSNWEACRNPMRQAFGIGDRGVMIDTQSSKDCRGQVRR